MDLLLGRAKELRASAGDRLVREGETSNRLFVVVKGGVRVCRQFGTPDEVELIDLGAGEFFGEMCILETLPRSATVVATVESRLLSLSSLDFLHLYKQMPGQYGILILNLARDLSRRLRRIDEVFAARH